MKVKSLVALIAALFGYNAVYADSLRAPVPEETMCYPHEQIYFSCPVGEKIISVCASGNISPKNGYVQYRFGHPGKPELEIVPHSVLSAAWFYSIKTGLNENGDADDFIWITRKVNGGYNGYDDRLALLNGAIRLLGIQDCVKLNNNGIYLFEDSKAYNEKLASFAWGLWNDPHLKKGEKAKNKAEALKGYRRYIALDDAAGAPVEKESHRPKDKGWYKIGDDVRVREYSQLRIDLLGSMSE